MAKVNDLKQENIQKIRECLYDGKVWTKNDLALKTQLALSTTTNILQELLKSQEIAYIGDRQSTGGRKSKEYQLNKDFRHLLKVVFKKNVKDYEFIFEVVDLYNQIIDQKEVVSLKGKVEEFLEFLKEVLQEDDLIEIISISIPGVCYQGFIDVCDFEDFQNLNILEILKKEVKQRVIIENDVNCASIGFVHLYPQFQNSIVVYQPAVDYIGCGIIIEGKLYNGFSHFAGELRYLPFYDHHQQTQLLKDNPQALLEKQIATLCCVLNPEAIGICSDVLEKINLSLPTISFKHQPQIIQIDQLYSMIKEGLFQIGKKNMIGDNKDE